MRILGVGASGDLGDLYLRCAEAGHDVRVYARDFAEHRSLAGMLHYVPDYRRELSWLREAGEDGYLVFETADRGEEQDALRREGFFVIGGSAFGDRLERDRAYGMDVLAELGLVSAPLHVFTDFDAASGFLRGRPRRYVFKMNGTETSSWRNYVGQADDGADVLALLRGQRARLAEAGVAERSFVLMDHVEGVETGIGAYFDGRRFLTPACVDFEHKRFFAGDVGELTCEMGTLVSYQHAGKLFERTLAKLAPRLAESGYVGYVNLNTIINGEGIFPLELTCRFGYPGFAILDALQIDGWPALFEALRRGAPSFRTRPGFAVGVVLTVPPFPYRYGYAQISRGLPISFAHDLDDDARAGIHLGEVERVDGELVTGGATGYVMVATGVGATVQEAQGRAYQLAQKVHVPNLRYRTDIGARFLARDAAALAALGHLPALSAFGPKAPAAQPEAATTLRFATGSNDPLCALGRQLADAGYAFTAITPASHARLLGRAPGAAAHDLRGVFGWSLPFAPALLPPAMLRALTASGELHAAGQLARAGVRFASLGGGLFAHSAYPTQAADSVFFGPDTYRFCALLQRRAGRPRSVLDLGCGSGAGGLVIAQAGAVEALTLTDINPRALRFAAANAALCGVPARTLASDLFAAVEALPELTVANPPYMHDPAGRAYRHGGGRHGEGLSLRIVREWLARSRPGQRLILYTGSAIVGGEDALGAAITALSHAAGAQLRYEELDPDVFGEELDLPGYERVERIAAVAAELTR